MELDTLRVVGKDYLSNLCVGKSDGGRGSILMYIYILFHKFLFFGPSMENVERRLSEHINQKI